MEHRARSLSMRHRRTLAAVAAAGVAVGATLTAGGPSAAVVPPPSSTLARSLLVIVPPPTTEPPPITAEPVPTRLVPTTTSPPTPSTSPPTDPAPPRTTAAAEPVSSAPTAPDQAPADQAPPVQPPAPAPPAPAPACAPDAIDDYYTVATGVLLDVPYDAGLGHNDSIVCAGSYTIDILLNAANGSVSQTPNQYGAFQYIANPGFTGADTFGYELNLNQSPADQAVAHITVTDSCSVIAYYDTYSTPYETPLVEPAPGFLVNDVVECQPFTTHLAAPPTDGTATVATDGSFDYTPDAGFWGSDKFTYEIRDANDAVMATSAVRIAVAKPPCVAADDEYSTLVDTPLNVAAAGVLDNDFVCPDLTTIEVDQQPANGTVALQPDGSFLYTPNAGFLGKDSFTYRHLKDDPVLITTEVLAAATVTLDVTATPPETTEPPPETTEPPPETTEPPPETTEPETPPATTEPAATTAPPGTSPGTVTEPPPPTQQPPAFRVATFNASLSRGAEGELVEDLSAPDDVQAQAVAAILQHTRPDIVLLNEFDHVEGGAAVDLFRTNYLLAAQNGGEPIDYPYYYLAPSNTGVPSGFDLDNDGTVGGPNDAFGFGEFPGQFGMVILSRHPIVTDQVRTFQQLLWASMPGARLPDDPATPEPADWYSADELAVLPLSSKSHWDVPVDVDGRIVHVLASHPTPPVFDGPEDRNGLRNADEIAFWADYVAGADTAWIVDDSGAAGGLAAGAEFVVVGDLNSDPLDGDSVPGAAAQLLALDGVQDPLPSSQGAVSAALAQGGANAAHAGDPAFDTADFADEAPGNLRADYVVPSAGFVVVDAAVLWPYSGAVLPFLDVSQVEAASDHRLVWVDLG